MLHPAFDTPAASMDPALRATLSAHGLRLIRGSRLLPLSSVAEMLRRTDRADAVCESNFRAARNVRFHGRPRAGVIADALAVHADRQQAFEHSNVLQRGLQLPNQPLVFRQGGAQRFLGSLALV